MSTFRNLTPNRSKKLRLALARSACVALAALGLARCAMKNDARYEFLAQGGAPPAIIPDAGSQEASRQTEDFSPTCSSVGPTAAGLDIKKGVQCTAKDPQICFRTCGPQSVGWKSETCSAGVYAEGTCQFPGAADYSCFKIPPAIDMTVCPATKPQASQACTVPQCTLCNVNGQYIDSSGNVKNGYCVCGQPSVTNGTRNWSCASSTAWPCPQSNGC